MQSIVESAPVKRRGNPYRDADGKFCKQSEAVYIVDSEGRLKKYERHLPGKHNQKDHAGGQNKIRPSQVSPPPPKDATNWAINEDRDLNGPSALAYGGISDVSSKPLQGIAKHQGFDAKPTKGSVDDVIKNGGTEIHRGITPHARSGTSAEEIEDRMINGAYEPGKGNYGNGYYFSTSSGIANMYASTPIVDKGYSAKPVAGGRVVRAALRKDAKIVNYEDIQKQQKEWFAKHHGNVHWDTHSTDYKVPEGKISPRTMDGVRDPGHFAALMGYDAIRVPLMNRDRDKLNKARIQKKIGNKDLGDEIVVLNRGALVVDG